MLTTSPLILGCLSSQFSSYKKDRTKILESLADLDNPIRKKSFSEAALKEVRVLEIPS